MQNENQNPFGEIIHRYTRAQAIRDGVLFDLSRLDATQAHWKCPVACTAAVWAIFSNAVMCDGRSIESLIHEASFQIIRVAEQQPGTNVAYFAILIGGIPCQLKAHGGPGDTEDQVITIMLPSES